MERRHITEFDTSGGTLLRDEEPVLQEAGTKEWIAPAVRAELQRVLASHHFETSKRCQAFLRYTVEQTLAGRGELKERVIGMEVFDRTPSYDTNQDPVVRMTAGEVRKRLALYYQGTDAGSTVRLELPVGGYVPRFASTWVEETTPATALLVPHALSLEPISGSAGDVPELPKSPLEEAASTAARHPAGKHVLRIALIALSLLLAATLLVLPFLRHHLWPPKTALDRFWAPLLVSEDPVLISIGQIVPVYAEVHHNQQRSSLGGITEIGKVHGYPPQVAVAVLGDAVPMANIAALLATHNKPYSIRPQANTSFADLQANSVVLLGAFDNDWSINLTDKLRFHFSTEHGVTWISDREHPAAKIGLLSPDGEVEQMKEDYGLVVRMYDQETKKMVVIVAGVAPFATQVGGNLITNPAYLEEYARSAPPGWDRKNIEILYRTGLIDGETSPPQIIAVSLW